MSEIDDLLNGLRSAAPDPRLATMDAAVMAGLSASREKAVGRRGLVLTGLLALGIGLGAGAVAPQRAQAEQAVALNAVPPSAPSSLLMGAR